MATGKMDAKVCRHFAATTKEKGATLSRNPLIYLVGWRLCALNFILLIFNILI
ncbi:hypothetical protein ACU0J0_20760 [Escherichia coli]|uniref:hypothetical protein n=1 Tax=Escherichia coli TaxID=562 RepID=UPI001821FA56|nr:hypothetical protein [Escherichia coli]HBA5702174.1 hypothetical protein [Escherichia coli]HBA5795217.1 hypothetical protein [Escherichia coli]HEI3112014.1 hypothetical protein [Escherichia coli]